MKDIPSERYKQHGLLWIIWITQNSLTFTPTRKEIDVRNGTASSWEWSKATRYIYIYIYIPTELPGDFLGLIV